MRKIQAPIMLLLASVALFVRGCDAAQKHEILHDKMSHSSTGGQQMLVWGLFFVVAVVWLWWTINQNRKQQ